MDLSALLDDLSSTRSSISQRVCALQAIEQLLATICSPRGSQSKFNAFILVQDTFESNVASRLVTVLASWLSILQNSLETAKVSEHPPVLQPIMQALSILQGVALLHEPSKAFLGRRWCIQLFLDLISISKHIPHSPDALDSKHLSEEGLLPPASNLANSVLDTLLCVLVDTPKATRCFEEVGGLDILVRTLKRPGVSRDVRMKCLEFLYFYLLPENTPPNNVDDCSPMEPIWTSSPDLSLSLSSDVSFEADETFAPNPKVAELRMLRRDIDFVPATPTKKMQVANLGIGSPLRARAPSTPSKRRRRDANSGISPSSSNSSLNGAPSPVAEPRTPRREHVRGRSDVTLVNSQNGGRHSLDSGRSSQEDIPRTPRYSPVTPVRPKNEARTPTRLHTRGSSMAEATLVGNPIGTPKKVRLLLSEDGPLLNGELASDGSRLRSTAEKTALLSNYLGNVGALVEGMKKAGAWGLE